jgi:PTH1 family peptidyl-tRNA hydrolase
VKLIVGLGNPGIEYQFTPHNLGFLAVDRLASESGVEIRNRQCRALTGRITIGSETILLAKPETFMNLSGLSVHELVEKHEIRPETDLIVIYDELDLPFGTIRVRERGSSAGHNGMKSVIGALGTEEFLRIEDRGRSPRSHGGGGEVDFVRGRGGGDESLQPQARSRARSGLRIGDNE